MGRIDLSIASRTEGGWSVVDVGGEIDVFTAPKLREHLVGVIEGGSSHLVVDLLDVSFMDSTGLGVLVGALRRVRETGGELVLVCAEGAVRRVLGITGLDQLFPVRSSVAEAISA